MSCEKQDLIEPEKVAFFIDARLAFVFTLRSQGRQILGHH